MVEIKVDPLKLRETLKKHAPVLTHVVTSRRNAPWFNYDERTAKQERRAAGRKGVKTGQQVDHRDILMSLRKL